MADEQTNPGVLHERSDIRPLAVTATAAGVLLGTLAIVLLLWFFFGWLRRSGPAVIPRAGLAPVYNSVREPLLQRSSRDDLEAMRVEEDKLLNGYRWVDRERGIAAIPIDRAIAIAAERGVPAAIPAGDLKLYPPAAGRRETGYETPSAGAR